MGNIRKPLGPFLKRFFQNANFLHILLNLSPPSFISLQNNAIFKSIPLKRGSFTRLLPPPIFLLQSKNAIRNSMSKKLICFDWAIKRLLRNKANFVVLEGFLSELLFDDIKIEQILESESNQETENDKFNRVDILTQNSKNELVIIEIQSTYEIYPNTFRQPL